MNGTWIKLQTSLLRSPKIVRMMSALDADKFRTLGGTVSAWCLADEHADDDGVIEMGIDELDALIGLPGLGAAMMKVGWLTELPDGSIQFPDYQAHNGPTAKRRAQETSRKGRARRRTNVRTACGHLSASDADDMRNREEKRREDKNRDIERESTTEEPVGGSTVAPPAPAPPDDDDIDLGVDPLCSMDQALSAASQTGIEAEVAECWWHDLNARGWLDAKGHLVRNWRSSLASYARKWVSNAERGSRRSGGNSGANSNHARKDSKIGW